MYYEINAVVKREVLKRSVEMLKALQKSLKRENNRSAIQIVFLGRKAIEMRLVNFEEGEEVTAVTLTRDIDIDVYVDKPIDKNLIFHCVELSRPGIEFLSKLGRGFDDILIKLEYHGGGVEKAFVKDRTITLEL